jgi:hypothetical protein
MNEPRQRAWSFLGPHCPGCGTAKIRSVLHRGLCPTRRRLCCVSSVVLCVDFRTTRQNNLDTRSLFPIPIGPSAVNRTQDKSTKAEDPREKDGYGISSPPWLPVHCRHLRRRLPIWRCLKQFGLSRSGVSGRSQSEAAPSFLSKSL